MAQKRRRDQLKKRKDRRQILLCVFGGLAAVLLSAGGCLLVHTLTHPAPIEETVSQAAVYYDVNQPFTLSDLTPHQLERIRQERRIRVSDGPRGISIGDSFDTLLMRFPTDYAGEQPEKEQILYCAEYFENANGVMTALPPRGLLTVEDGSSRIVITFMAPTTAYPAGTQDAYRRYEHVYCIYTIEPDGMTVSSIELGLTK